MTISGSQCFVLVHNDCIPGFEKLWDVGLEKSLNRNVGSILIDRPSFHHKTDFRSDESVFVNSLGTGSSETPRGCRMVNAERPDRKSNDQLFEDYLSKLRANLTVSFQTPSVIRTALKASREILDGAAILRCWPFTRICHSYSSST
jgi:hypothetical protein